MRAAISSTKVRKFSRRPPAGRRSCAGRWTSGRTSLSISNRPMFRMRWPRSPIELEMMMRITQGTFSYLPDFTEEEIAAQVQYCLASGWAVSLEYTDDPHPRNAYWDMWGLPMFDLKDAAGVMAELDECRKAHSDCY